MNENQKNGDRQEKLREIVKDLHEGSDIGGVRKRFADLIRDVSPQEIADMEQALIAEGVPVEQVQKVCDVHVQVFEQALGRQKRQKTLPGHPVHTFRQENRTARRLCRKIQGLIRAVSKGRKRQEFERKLQQLKEIETHYRRKENQLFPVLESVGFTGPTKVMWGKHDEIRSQLREVEATYRAENWGSFRSAVRGVLRAIKRMIFMEERILYPIAMKKLSDKQWAEIRQGEADIGYAWIQPGNLWDPSLVLAGRVARDLGSQSTAAPPVQPSPGEAAKAVGEAEAAGQAQADGTSAEISLDVGRLTAEQINLMLKNLPIDMTFVDENDTVRYYSQGRERIFPRSPAIIGRAVQNCHPPKSVDVVEKILESFRKKEKDVAEFWITVNDRFIHIRYYPLYDEDGTYRGVIEVSQDVTAVRTLSGQKGLLDW